MSQKALSKVDFFCSGVIFDDGSEECDIDAIILATGYKIGFPCLDEGLVTVEKNQVPLYKYVFPYDHKHHTLAIIGCLQPLGSTIPLSELQGRWACKVFSGASDLPSNEEMKKEMDCKRTAMSNRYYNSERHTIQVVLQRCLPKDLASDSIIVCYTSVRFQKDETGWGAEMLCNAEHLCTPTSFIPILATHI